MGNHVRLAVGRIGSCALTGAPFSVSLACHTHATLSLGFITRLFGLLLKYVQRYPPVLCPNVVALGPSKDCL